VFESRPWEGFLLVRLTIRMFGYTETFVSSTFQILFYALRPGLVRSQRPTTWHGLNIIVQLTFDAIIIRTLGWSSFYYFIASSFFAGSLHPLSGHFIAEHYLWDGLEQETYSYYGPLNWLAYNVRIFNSCSDLVKED
jgi:sphingolipid delta-4 desaturase